MKHEIQCYTISARCPRKNTHKVQKLVKGIGIETQITELQKTFLLHTPTGILLNVLEVYGNFFLLYLRNINTLLKQCAT